MKKSSKKKEIVLNVLLSLFSIIMFIALMELFFRIYLGSNLRYDYVEDLWILRPNQRGFTYPNSKLATINSEGFRGSLIDPQKSTVVFLGDSFTFGYAIGDNDTLTENLRRELAKRGIESLNLVNGGVPGYGISQMISLFKMRYLPYNPELVVLNFIRGDVYRKDETGDPMYVRKQIVRKLIRSSSGMAFMKPRLEIFREQITGTAEFKEANFEGFLQSEMENIAEFDGFLSERNISLLLHFWVYDHEQNLFYAQASDLADRYGLEYLPNYYPKVFESYLGPVKAFYAEDGHPSELQTQRLAAAMADDLIRMAGRS